MSTFNQRIRPATEAHMHAQFSFLEDMSKTVFQSFQKISELHLQLTQTLIADSARLGREIVSAEKPQEILSATAAQAEPAVEKLREYKDSLARISADAQAELTRCAERHVPETSRTAKALAEELVKISAEAAQKAMQTQQDVMRQGAASIDGGSSNASRVEATDTEQQTQDSVQAGLRNGAEAVKRAAADAPAP